MPDAQPCQPAPYSTPALVAHLGQLQGCRKEKMHGCCAALAQSSTMPFNPSRATDTCCCRDLCPQLVISPNASLIYLSFGAYPSDASPIGG